jgi:hypothetical protein
MFCSFMPSIRVGKAIAAIAGCLFLGVVSLGAQGMQTFQGQVTDSACARPAGQAPTPNGGETAARCTIERIKTGDQYVLASAGNRAVYQLDDRDQTQPKAFAAQNVVVIGTLNKALGTIEVSDMFRALPSKVTQGKSVYIACDTCLRAMAKAKLAAYQQLLDWNRFVVVPDRDKADLVLLFAANPYMGDYLTRDGPDPRPIRVDTTFMSVIDPRTGQNLWSDSKTAGSWRVGGATKDLIDEFRSQLEAQQGQFQRQLVLADKARPHKAAADQGK